MWDFSDYSFDALKEIDEAVATLAKRGLDLFSEEFHRELEKEFRKRLEKELNYGK